MSLFKLRGSLSNAQQWMLGFIGTILFVLAWWGIAELKSVQKPIIDDFQAEIPSSIGADSIKARQYLDSLAISDSLAFMNATEFEKVYPILPPPDQVLKVFPELVKEDRLVFHTKRSVWLNIQGYLWAILISIPLGFLIGLIPLFRGLFNSQVNAMRYLPLTALTGLFIIWFGIEDQMKIAFLAFGIIVYLLPVVVQRIDEVKDVYLKTVFTLGASGWQTVKTVYIPSVLSKLMDDIRVLTAISWTYIIIAELLNRKGGIGSLIYIKSRQGQIPKVFAALIIIVLIGFLQDRIFVYIDKRIFPHKYQSTLLPGSKETQYGIYTALIILFLAILIQLFIPLGGILVQILWIVIIASVIIMGYGELRLFKSAKTNG